MAKKMMIFLVIFLAFFAANCAQKNPQALIKTNSGNVKLDIEIADDINERSKGLMFRNSMEEFHGMLFVFEAEKEHAFWMKNTLIPLDMIFINSNNEIIDIKYAVPCESDPCPTYNPSGAVLYVLETNGNFTKRHGIDVGDRIEIKNMKSS